MLHPVTYIFVVIGACTVVRHAWDLLTRIFGEV